MNKELTNQIIRHIYNCLGISVPGKNNNLKSIMMDDYLLSRKVSFEDGEKKNMWGIQFEVERDSTLQFVLADCSDSEVPEYAMAVLLKDSPSYATYLCYQEYFEGSLDDISLDRPMIACNINEGGWLECPIYMQGSFLCGMEKIKEITYPISRLKDESVSDHLISFIKFFQEKMESENEGQEN